MDDLYPVDKSNNTIRIASSDDAPAIAEIYNQYIGKSTMTLVPVMPSYYEKWLSEKSERENIWVSTYDNTVIAWGIIKKYSDREGYAYAAETSVYIDRTHLHQGIGTKLKKHLIAEAKLLKYKHLVAKIWATNRISIDYNLKLGYEMVGIQKQIGYVDQQWIDVAILQLVLTE